MFNQDVLTIDAPPLSLGKVPWLGCLASGTFFEDYVYDRESRIKLRTPSEIYEERMPHISALSYPEFVRFEEKLAASYYNRRNNWLAKGVAYVRPAALKPIETYLLVWDYANARWVRQDAGRLEYTFRMEPQTVNE